ncbi:MAG TPA: hypothetical protein VNQ73_10010 [Ilumatobacter sp.]|nr:hypothetical protein [Ilumatobacter sp.]
MRREQARGRRHVVLWLCIAAIAGCSSASEPADGEAVSPSSAGSATAASPAPEPPAEATTTRPSTATSAAEPPATDDEAPAIDAELLDRLAALGIAVFADPLDPAPLVPVGDPDPLRLTAWQVHSMDTERESGGGLPADVLDASEDDPDLVAPEGLLTPSAMVMAWARGGETDAARLAADAFGPAIDDPVEGVLIPRLALTLFTVEMVRALEQVEVEPGPSTTSVTPGGLRSTLAHEPTVHSPRLSSGPCSTLIDFVNDGVSWVLRRLRHLAAPEYTVTVFGADVSGVVNTVVKVAVGGVNFVIDTAHVIIEGIARVALSVLFGYVTKIAAIVGTVSLIASQLRAWTLHFDSDPLKVVAPDSGTVNARVSLGGLDRWPGWLQDCATRAGRPLPPLQPEGHPVTWKPDPNALILATTHDRRLRTGGVADFHFDVVAEPEGPGRHTVTGDVSVRVTVQRDDLRRIDEAFEALIQSQLGATIGKFLSAVVMPYFDQVKNAAFSKLSRLRDVRGTTRITVQYGAITPPEPVTGPIGTCDLIPDDDIALLLGWEVAATTTSADTGDGSGASTCGKFDREIQESDWDVHATGDPQAPVFAGVDFRGVTIVRETMTESAAGEFAAGISDLQAGANAEGWTLDPTEGIGDEGYLLHAGPYAGPMILRVGDELVWITVHAGLLGAMQPVSASDYLEIARVVADRLAAGG